MVEAYCQAGRHHVGIFVVVEAQDQLRDAADHTAIRGLLCSCSNSGNRGSSTI